MGLMLDAGDGVNADAADVAAVDAIASESAEMHFHF